MTIPKTAVALLGALSLLTSLPLLAAAPAAAQGIDPMETERFRVEVKGVQTTTWSYDVPGAGGCSHGASGRGTEVVRFATTKPQVIDATRIGRNFVQLGAGLAAGGLDGRAKVTRQGKTEGVFVDPLCGGTGGGQAGPEPDCGTKRGPLDLTIGYQPFGKRRGVTLRHHIVPSPVQLFRNCPVNGVSFPTLLERSTRGSEIVSAWPVREIMDRRFKKTILIGRGKKVQNDATSRQTTTIRWEATFRRVGRVRDAALASAAADEPACTVKAGRSYRLGQASRGGMPVQVTCDRPTAVFAAVELDPAGRASRFINFKDHPGSHGWSRPREVEGGKAETFRVRLQRFAARAVRKAGGSRLIFTLGIRESDGHYHNNPNPGGSARSRLTAK